MNSMIIAPSHGGVLDQQLSARRGHFDPQRGTFVRTIGRATWSVPDGPSRGQNEVLDANGARSRERRPARVIVPTEPYAARTHCRTEGRVQVENLIGRQIRSEPIGWAAPRSM